MAEADQRVGSVEGRAMWLFGIDDNLAVGGAHVLLDRAMAGSERPASVRPRLLNRSRSPRSTTTRPGPTSTTSRTPLGCSPTAGRSGIWTSPPVLLNGSPGRSVRSAAVPGSLSATSPPTPTSRPRTGCAARSRLPWSGTTAQEGRPTSRRLSPDWSPDRDHRG